MAKRIRHKYFDWICELIENHDEYGEDLSYTKLLQHLDSIEFTYILEMDGNRFTDGEDLRYRFGYEMHYQRELIEDNLDGRPCSVLEMMVALAVRCEEIMDSPDEDNRTGQWFWEMIDSLGLGGMTDLNFDAEYVDRVISKFLNRKYKSNGSGGLFTVKKPAYDMRNVEIWSQMMWYLDEYLKI